MSKKDLYAIGLIYENMHNDLMILQESHQLDNVQLSNGETINLGGENWTLKLVDDGKNIKLIADEQGVVGVEYSLAKSHPLSFRATVKEDNKPLFMMRGATKDKQIGGTATSTQTVYFYPDAIVKPDDGRGMGAWGKTFDQLTDHYSGISMSSAINIIIKYIKDNNIRLGQRGDTSVDNL